MCGKLVYAWWTREFWSELLVQYTYSIKKRFSFLFIKISLSQVRAKSSLNRCMLKNVLEPLANLYDDYGVRRSVIKRSEYYTILGTLGRMLKAIYDGVHLPCKEQAMIVETLLSFYRITGMTSRWNNASLDLLEPFKEYQGYFWAKKSREMSIL